MEFQIEKGIPLKKKGGKKYPFESMEVGDSFFIPAEEGRVHVAAAAVSYGRWNGMKFSIRKVDSGYRCWRIA